MAAWLVLAMLALPAGCGRGEPRGEPSPAAARTASAPTSQALPGTVAPSTPTPRRSERAPAGLAGQDLTRILTGQKVVALTFDSGANADAVPSILGTLAAERIRATFFLTGDFVDRFPTQARAIVAAGHRLGNHSARHPHFPILSAADLRAEVLDAQRTMLATAGADPRPFFRFPYGDRTTGTISAVNALGYVAVRWTVDSLGWQGTAEQTAATVTARVLAAAQPGEIVLMHVGAHPRDRSMLDAAALPGVIAGLRQRGYAFVTLDALLGGA